MGYNSDFVGFEWPQTLETFVLVPLFAAPITSCDHDHGPLLQEPRWLGVSLAASY